VNLVLLESHELDDTGTVTLTGARAAHLLEVLKVTEGSSVRIGLLDGPHGTATVTSRGDTSVVMGCRFDTGQPARPPIDLLLALPRPKVMRRLWAQLAALGVGRIMLTNAGRVERHYFDTHVLEAAVYRPLLIEGLQQARDTRLPLVSTHRQFKILIEDDLDALAGGAARVVADPSASLPLDRAVARSPGARLLLAIGPEGGWNPFERSLLGAHGFVAAGMGDRTLRSDTACIALLALAHHAVAQAASPVHPHGVATES
jgi:RsmE family RNA methyltransferase